jgi:hypothetical protein
MTVSVASVEKPAAVPVNRVDSHTIRVAVDRGSTELSHKVYGFVRKRGGRRASLLL